MTEKVNSKDRKMAEKTGKSWKTEKSGRSEKNISAHETALAFDELRQTVARLRAADGCPWDRAQTHETLKPACVEEAAEVVCGINILRETGKPESLVEELGDLLLQVIMHAQIGEEEGLFSLKDVIDCVNEKMIRRHPHVFGEKSLEAIRRLREKRGNTSAPQELRLETETGNEENKNEDANPSAAQLCRNMAEPGSREKEEEVKADWKYIKSLEKQGREWEEPYLFEAFDEAEKLIDVARERKKRKS